MPRWEPDARERLVIAAMQLFSEQGYDETTVAQIAQQAGGTPSTFHRHLPDTRASCRAARAPRPPWPAGAIAAAPADAPRSKPWRMGSRSPRPPTSRLG